MKRPWLAGAIVLVAVSNAWVLIHVARNRGGAPVPEIVLTERELQYQGKSRDNSSLTLQLRWQNPAPLWRRSHGAEAQNAAPDGWFDQRKLAELGFDCSVPPSAGSARAHYNRMRSRMVYVALEYDGPSWKRWIEELKPEREIAAGQHLEIESQTGSRLVVIDAASDPTQLRGKYTDPAKVLVLPGVVRLVFEDSARAAPARPSTVHGAIVRILSDTINVPPPHRQVLAPLGARPAWESSRDGLKINPPRYSVRLRVGTLFEPWVAGTK